MAAEAALPSSDMFDEIVMADERFHGEGYEEGYAEGSHVGVVEGRRYGSLHGAKMGSEIGCYLGFALTWQCLLQKCMDEKNSKKIRALDSLIGMIQKFPYEDPTYDKLQEDLEKIRGKFKQNRNAFDPWQRAPWRRTGNKGTQRHPLVKMDFSKLNLIQ
ncbi:protein LTO1 homolog isoform X1 [Chroicocephalus ridibundus]|uniref:protein LTO1 homolog isoform X1 n=1 Tax=Chroicocephalus ridibundus TaxID=1192867 RepID=UPI002FDCA295